MSKEKVEFKSANKVELVAKSYISTDDYMKGRRVWEIKTKSGEYVDSCDNGIGKFYSYSFGEVKTFEEFVDIWKTRFIVKGFRSCKSDNKKNNGYLIDLYNGQGVCKDYFNEVVRNIKILLDNNFIVEYNDDHGVGNFKKKGKKYLATHHRHYNETKETLTIDGIRDFLREFYDLGYSYTNNNDWDDALSENIEAEK